MRVLTWYERCLRSQPRALSDYKDLYFAFSILVSPFKPTKCTASEQENIIKFEIALFPENIHNLMVDLFIYIVLWCFMVDKALESGEKQKQHQEKRTLGSLSEFVEVPT